MDYRNEMCTPKPINECVIHENELIMPLQISLDHQFTKLFVLKPNLKTEFETIKKDEPEAELVGIIKSGTIINIFKNIIFTKLSFL